MRLHLLKLIFCAATMASPLWAETPMPSAAPTQATQRFDVSAATDAYLASVPAADRLRTNAYFEGGYWLQLWDFLITAAMMLILLTTGLSSKMRDWAEGLSRFKPVQTFLYFLEFTLLTTIVAFPFTLYGSFFREREYGLMNQTLGGWLGDFLITQGASLVLTGIFAVIIFGIIRKLERSWHVWGAVFYVVFLAFVMLVYPVYIAPLTNNYQTLNDSPIREMILNLARANGVPATDVYEFDASKQSKRVGANVSGFLGTERISLNDNLLNRCTPAEIKMVMAHEIGHYVLHHIWKDLMFIGIGSAIFFVCLRRALLKCLAKWGTRWKIRGAGDVAVLPLLILLVSIFVFVSTPITNPFTRVQEAEADLFGLNAGREPDAEAKVDLMLGEYRKLDPTPLEEFIFFDHPSGRSRIHMAMQWKAGHLNELSDKKE